MSATCLNPAERYIHDKASSTALQFRKLFLTLSVGQGASKLRSYRMFIVLVYCWM